MKKIISLIISIALTIGLIPPVMGAQSPILSVISETNSNNQLILNNITNGVGSVQLSLTLEGLMDNRQFIWNMQSPDVFTKLESTKNGDNTDLIFYIDSKTPITQGNTVNLGKLSGSPVKIVKVNNLKTLDKKLTERKYDAVSVTYGKADSSGSTDSSDSNANNNYVPLNETIVINSDTIKDTGIISFKNGVKITIKNPPQSGEIKANVTQKSANSFELSITLDGKAIEKADFLIEIPYPNGGDDVSVIAYDTKNPENIITQSMMKNGRIIIKTNEIMNISIKSNKKSFSDISNAWYTSDIEFLSSRQVIDGFNDSTFKPSNNITRAEVVALIAKMEKISKTNKSTNFTDVPDSSWYSSYVSWASDNKIISGNGDGKFRPESKITREELSVIITNYIKFKTNTAISNSDITNFADNNNISSWAKSSVAYLSSISLVNGKSDNKFFPKDNTTRAETSAILKRYLVNSMK